MMNKHLLELYDEITRELTIFENNEDSEMSDEDWLKLFYTLLVKTVNCIQFISEENCDGQD